MKHKNRIPSRPVMSRRGITLVEMLVTVAVLVIIMTILVQVFQAATGAVSSAKTYQQLDDQLRRVSGLLRSDLEGVTAHFTPPLDPALNLGYFEYGENEFADAQGEDSDDYVRFTAKAPDGRPFTGRMWIGNPVNPANGVASNPTIQPITITSEYAEIIYFLRNGNLYRRVLLVAPQLQSQILQTINNQVPVANGNPVNAFYPHPVFGGTPATDPTSTTPTGVAVSWLGVNDLSARPASRGAPYNMTKGAKTNGTLSGPSSIILNTLGDLTNRENRFAAPRFCDDFAAITVTNGTVGYSVGPDGVADDQNGDNVPDFYATLYPHAFSAAAGAAGQLIFEPFYPGVPRAASGPGAMAFPYIFPGAYSVPQVVSNDQYGWIHAPYPEAMVYTDSATCTAYRFEDNPLAYLQSINHNPIDVGDNLPNQQNTPSSIGNLAKANLKQTWWGFPTWRETLSPSWNDPTLQVNDQVNVSAFTQPNGLVPVLANNMAASGLFAGLTDGPNLLPPMSPGGLPSGFAYSLLRRNIQPDCDGLGTTSVFMGGSTSGPSTLWALSWEDDLIMTNVRSFDIKAYDNALAQYADLGWGDDVRLQAGWAPSPQFNSGANAFIKAVAGTAPFLTGNFDFSYLWSTVANASASAVAVYPPRIMINNVPWDYINGTFAHEGRMPPLIEDNRLDAQYPNPNYIAYSQPFKIGSGSYGQYAPINDGKGDTFNFGNYSSNIGDDNSGVIRLRRVWDSWSTNYTRAPANGVYNNPTSAADPLNKSPWGPNGGTPPIYPSYPPPYPAPLRGIQIQIRVTDPTSQKIKSLTIRQDFTDKL